MKRIDRIEYTSPARSAVYFSDEDRAMSSVYLFQIPSLFRRNISLIA